MANSSEEIVYTQNLQENRLIWRRRSAPKPNTNVKDRASETKHSSSNPVPSSKQLKSEPAKPVKSAKKMELVVAKLTRPGHLVKTPVRYSS